MSRGYTKVEHLADAVKERLAQGETYQEIAKSYGLRKMQLRKLMERLRQKERMVARGCIVRPKGRPRKEYASEEEKLNEEIVQLRMQVELLRNFLYEVGRR